MVQARHGLAGREPGHPSRRGRPRCRVHAGVRRGRLLHQHSRRRPHRREGVDRDRLRRPRSRARARRPGPHARPPPLFLEERQVGQGSAVPRARPARLLGATGLPQLRGPMAGEALLERLTWRVATVREVVAETAAAATLYLDLDDWPGHLPGMHVDVRLTADDGYQAERSYSIASAPEDPHLALTVQRLEDGEVSPWMTGVASPGDVFELRGPVGGYFVWDDAETAPVLLVGGGSGVVPLMSMARHRQRRSIPTRMRLLYSARAEDDVLYRGELDEL